MHIPSVLKPHARLTQDQAVAIFRVRGWAPSAAKIAACFDISEKAVRDIWTARTWSRETNHLEPTRPVELKQIGRPKGCRDSKPRKKRVYRQRTVSQAHTPCQHEGSQKAAGHSCCFMQQGPYQNVVHFAQNNPINLETCSRGVHDASSSSGEHFHCRAPWTMRVISVDDQLFYWGEEFRTKLHNNDPFCNDWQSVCLSRIM